MSAATKTAVIWALAGFVFLESILVAFVHYSCEGHYDRAFLPGTMLGVPARETAAGMQPITTIGWDAQCYYYQSNDLFARRDAKQHIDNPMYRYQRIGVPLMAGGLAELFGYELTPPFLYHTLQMALSAAGFGILVYWLLIQKLSPWYACGWLLAGGTTHSLLYGMPDPVGDAFFAFAFCALLSRRMLLFTAASTMLVLIREGYVVFPAMVWLLTALGRFQWSTNRGYLSRLAVLSIPGVFLIGWTLFLAWQLQASPIEARKGSPLIDWPLRGFLKCFRRMWRSSNWFELRLIIPSVISLAVITIALFKHARKSLALACTIPFVVLTTMLGVTIWEAYGGHMKSNGTILMIGIFLLPLEKGMLLRFVLAMQVVVGSYLLWTNKVEYPPLFNPAVAANQELLEKPHSTPDFAAVRDQNSSVKWLGSRDVINRQYQGALKPLHREIMPITVAVTNHSSEPMQTAPNRRAVRLGYILYRSDGETVLSVVKTVLDRPLMPGETREVTVNLELRKPHKYVLQLSLMQEPDDWFFRTNPKYGARYKFRVE